MKTKDDGHPCQETETYVERRTDTHIKIFGCSCRVLAKLLFSGTLPLQAMKLQKVFSDLLRVRVSCMSHTAVVRRLVGHLKGEEASHWRDHQERVGRDERRSTGKQFSTRLNNFYTLSFQRETMKTKRYL